MADLTATLRDQPLDRDHYSHIQYIRRVVNLVDLAAGANEIITVPAEHAIVGGYVVGRVTATSGGTPTTQVVFNAANLTGAVAVASLAKGQVTGFTTAASAALYVTAATKVSLTLTGAVYTAGQVELVIGIVSVLNNT